jgi:hypothetical protein
MNRLEMKSDLQFKLGLLFGPLLRIAERPAEYDQQELSEAVARYCYEYPKFYEEMRVFCESQPGHSYQVEMNRMWMGLQGVMADVCHDSASVADVVVDRTKMARAALDAIPLPRDSAILEAGSPFTTYCKIRDLCQADATKELALVDGYMDDTVFHRFLRPVREDVPITLVTSDLRVGAGKRDQQRHAAFLDVSRLFAQERGPTHYRLVLQPAGLLHDRWMRFDGKRLLNLGGSAKDAGDRQYFTITFIDPTPDNLNAFQKHIDTGTEYYGPSTARHR